MAITVEDIHVGEGGLDFDIQVKRRSGVAADISEATKTDIIFQRPDGTYFTRPAIFITDGSDGWIRYTTIVNDFDQAGTWKYQTYIEIGSDVKWGSIHKFKVLSNLPLG